MITRSLNSYIFKLVLLLATVAGYQGYAGQTGQDGFVAGSDPGSQTAALTPEDTLYTGVTVFEGDDRFIPDPRKAAIYSAVLPGLGQVYNRRYWKVPIVYGGFAALSWYAMFTHDEYARYRNAHSFRIDGNPETIDEFAGDFRYTEDVLKRFRDYYRRQRDRSYIWIAAFYALNIIEATVDAHFFEFDVSEDLGMKVSPVMTFPGQPVAGKPGFSPGMGVRFSVKF